jgi:hypothetical protein
MNLEKNQYKIIAASQTSADCQDAVDWGTEIVRAIVQPTSTTVGKVSIFDGAVETTASVVLTLTSGFETELKPYVVELGVKPTSSVGFHCTTGAGVIVTIVGRLG